VAVLKLVELCSHAMALRPRQLTRHPVLHSKRICGFPIEHELFGAPHKLDDCEAHQDWIQVTALLFTLMISQSHSQMTRIFLILSLMTTMMIMMKMRN
jgi:hypothetical protein